jgi:hypothetical protein
MELPDKFVQPKGLAPVSPVQTNLQNGKAREWIAGFVSLFQV